MGFLFPIVHAYLYLVFRSFATFLQRLNTALSLVYNNSNMLCLQIEISRIPAVLTDGRDGFTLYIRHIYLVCSWLLY